MIKEALPKDHSGSDGEKALGGGETKSGPSDSADEPQDKGQGRGGLHTPSPNACGAGSRPAMSAKRSRKRKETRTVSKLILNQLQWIK